MLVVIILFLIGFVVGSYGFSSIFSALFQYKHMSDFGLGLTSLISLLTLGAMVLIWWLCGRFISSDLTPWYIGLIIAGVLVLFNMHNIKKRFQ